MSLSSPSVVEDPSRARGWSGPERRRRARRRRIHPFHRLTGAGERFGVPYSSFWCDTPDGVRISGALLGTGTGDTAVVLAHGFLGHREKPAIRLVAEHLAGRFGVLVFDLRGHGRSGGACTGGENEAFDVHAVVAHARRCGFRKVVTVGGSLGGIAVLREAAMFHDSDAVVGISSPARWNASESAAVKRASWLFVSPIGRAFARRILGTRIRPAGDPEEPADLVGRISPTPLLLIHGTDDHFFPPADAELLYRRAGAPKNLLLIPGFGHAEDGFTPQFAVRLGDEIERLLA